MKVKDDKKSTLDKTARADKKAKKVLIKQELENKTIQIWLVTFFGAFIGCSLSVILTSVLFDIFSKFLVAIIFISLSSIIKKAYTKHL